MGLVLQSKQNGDYKPHPEGIHPAVCLDVIDLGLQETEFQGQRRMVNRLRLVFETEQKLEDGRNCTISKNFTASLHPKARLAEFLGRWRGRAVLPGETIDLTKLVGACCTIVVSQQENLVGQTYAAIDAVSKPTKKLVPSGFYDPVATRQRIADWQAKQAGDGVAARPVTAVRPAQVAVPTPARAVAAPAAPAVAAVPVVEYDPEVGF